MNNLFYCNFHDCNFNCESLSTVLYHVFIRHSLSYNFKMKCCFENCQQIFYKFISFKNHIQNDVDHQQIIIKYDELKCDFIDCNNSFQQINKLICHYYKHLEDNQDNKIKLKCVFKNCDYVTSSKSGYITHMARNHVIKTTDNLRESFLITSDLNDYQEYQDKKAN